MTEVQVENIIVSFSVSTNLDLAQLAEDLPDAQYHPEDAPAVILQFSQPHSMAAFSATGTVMVTGPKSMAEVHEVVRMILDRLKIVGIQPPDAPEVDVQNVTVSIDLHQELKLRTLAKSLQSSEFSPREFPGLVIKGDDPNTVILLFDTGKLVCNGKSLEEATIAVKAMVEKLGSFGIKMEENVCPK